MPIRSKQGCTTVHVFLSSEETYDLRGLLQLQRSLVTGPAKVTTHAVAAYCIRKGMEILRRELELQSRG